MGQFQRPLLRSIVALAMPAALSNILRSYRSPTSAVLGNGCGWALPGRCLPDLPEALKPMIGSHWQWLVSRIAPTTGPDRRPGHGGNRQIVPALVSRPATGPSSRCGPSCPLGHHRPARGVWRPVGQPLGRLLSVVAVTAIAARWSTAPKPARCRHGGKSCRTQSPTRSRRQGNRCGDGRCRRRRSANHQRTTPAR